MMNQYQKDSSFDTNVQVFQTNFTQIQVPSEVRGANGLGDT